MHIDHPFHFDPTYGYTRENLLALTAPEGPADFASFWQETYTEALRIPLRLSRRQIPSSNPDFTLYEIEFDSLGDVRIGGWLSVPIDGQFEHGLVVGHGYGGRDLPDFQRSAVTIAPCARGFHRSARADIPNEAMRHVVSGIGNRETYIHRGCVADFWCAATALLELFPQVAGKLHYWGGSFGGGIGALMLPWDARFHRACLDIPSFGNHPIRVQLPCVGSGEAVRHYYRRHPEVMEVLAYFDAATAARYMKIPVIAGCALFDPAVPPPGQFSIYNGLAGPKELFVRQMAHFEHPIETQESVKLGARVEEWWKE